MSGLERNETMSKNINGDNNLESSEKLFKFNRERISGPISPRNDNARRQAPHPNTSG